MCNTRDYSFVQSYQSERVLSYASKIPNYIQCAAGKLIYIQYEDIMKDATAIDWESLCHAINKKK